MASMLLLSVRGHASLGHTRTGYFFTSVFGASTGFLSSTFGAPTAIGFVSIFGASTFLSSTFTGAAPVVGAAGLAASTGLVAVAAGADAGADGVAAGCAVVFGASTGF